MNNKYFLHIITGCILIAFCICCESKSRVFNLKDFGAIANDGEDDSEAFTLALNKCRKNPGSTLIIPPGEYNYKNTTAMEFEYKAINGQYGEDVQGHFFKPDGEYVTALDLNGFDGVTIQAYGVRLIQEGWYETVSITNAKNIKIRGLTLTHKRPPFTTGQIITSTPQYFDMKIDTLKYPYLTDKITGRIHFFDTDKQRVYTGGWNEKKELLNDKQTIRVYSKTQPKIGDLCVLRHCAHNRAGILIRESTDITLEGVTIHSQPGMGIIGHSHLARAFLVKTGNVRIAGNVIQRSSGSAIQLGAEAGWRESGPVEDVIIENNRIQDCGYGHGQQKGSAINVEISGISDANMLNANIIIRNNIIQAVGENAVFIADTKGVEITGNRITGSINAIVVENAEDVTVENNGALPVFINGEEHGCHLFKNP